MMRKSLLSILLAVLCHVTMAQVLQENETAVVYYMPKTALTITLNYDMVKYTPGVFYQYAERYLGAQNVVVEERINYQLTDLTVEQYTTADTERAYKVTPQKGVQTQKLTLSEDGRLLGYNIGADSIPNSKNKIHNSKLKIKNSSTLMPLLEEQFMAGSTAKMAEGAAKMIYRIRETRLNILAGDVEHAPADGDAMRLVLDQLAEQEQRLVELFVGKSEVEHLTHTFIYTPTQSIEREVICRLSQHSGVVGKDDLSGEPIYLTLKATKQALQEVVEQNSKAPLPSQIYYNLPGRAQVSIEYQNQELYNAQYLVAQLGVAVPLAQEIFGNKQEPVIHFNQQTGNILSIQ